MMWDTVIVVLIVSVVALLATRSLYRTLTGKNDGCPCGGNCAACSSCGHGKNSTTNPKG